MPSLFSTAHFPGVLFAPIQSPVPEWGWSCHRGRAGEPRAGVTSFPQAASCTQLRGSERPGRLRGLEPPEVLPGTGKENPSGAWSIPLEPGASLWGLEHPPWSPKHPSAAQDAPGRDHPLPQSITPTAGRCFALVPHIEMTPGSFQDHGKDPRAHGWAGLRGSQHEIVPPVESSSSTWPQSPLRGLS